MDRDRSVSPTSQLPHRLRHADYTVAVLCPMGDELSPVLALLDEVHETLPTSRDQNAYRFGKIGHHNVVVVCMPGTGNNASAMVTTQLLNDFSQIRFGLLVGIGGGIPDQDYDDDDTNDIRLGDVVVGHSKGRFGGVMQFDRGKSTTQGFVMTGYRSPPPPVLAANVEVLRATHNLHGNAISHFMQEMLERYPEMEEKYRSPGPDRDRLFEASYVHEGGNTCKKCDITRTVKREQRNKPHPRIHYGTIGSSNAVVKDAQKRDELREMGILCVEMEAAGLTETFQCLVIRGISDYADSHKNNRWQPYAAATAAAYMKELLLHLPSSQVDSTRPMAYVLQGLSVMVNQINQSTGRTVEETRRKQEADILEWLSPQSINYSSLQNEFHQTATTGTGQWLLGSKQYELWREEEAGLMWLHGVAGCGKTILCSTVIQDLQDNVRNIAYWYFRFDSSTSQNVSQMLRSLTRQLSVSPIPERIRALYDQHCKRGSEPSFKELIIVLTDLIKDSGKVHIVLDALDECLHKDKRGQRDQLLDCIKHFTNECSNLHMLVTSRPEPDVRRDLSAISKYTFDIEDLIRGDVARYVNAALKDHRLASWSRSIKNQIKERLLEIEERRFRWADLQIKRFAQCTSLERLGAALTTIPKDLETTYRQAFDTIDEAYTDDVLAIMMWLAVSLEPLSAEQIAAVVNFRNPDYILTICSTLLVTIIDKDTTTIIKLAHFSVKEFLIIKLHESSTHWYQFTPELANNRVALSALKTVLEADILSDHTVNQGHPILRYAAVFWHRHASQALKGKDKTELETRISLLFHPNNERKFRNWLEMHDPEQIHGYQSGGTLYYAALLGFEAAVLELFTDEYQLSRKEGRHGNALNAAAVVGNVAIVQSMVRVCQGSTGFLNLARVAREIHTNATECFTELCQGPDPEITEEVAEAAAGNRSCGHEVIKVLMEKRRHEFRITERVIMAAARNWDCGTQVMDLLLEASRCLLPITEALLAAVITNRRSGKQIMLLLLEKAVRIQITAKIIALAAPRWNGYMMRRLSERLEVETPVTVLVPVVRYQHVTAVETLLSRGIDPNAGRQDGLLLLIAMSTGYGEIAELLLKYGADAAIPVADQYGRTPLIHASARGFSAVVELLLQNGADPWKTDRLGWTPLAYAQANGHRDTANLLLMIKAATTTQDEQIQMEDGDTTMRDGDIMREDEDITMEDDEELGRG